jgi:hypothetical protein
MTVTLGQLDAVMERASGALAAMDYLTCEALCLEALGMARQAGRYAYYARVLLPLQEARRQRRMISAAGEIQLGSGDDGFEPKRWLTEHDAGCIVLTHPHTAEDALALDKQARSGLRFIEVLFADNTQDNAEWMLQSVDGASVACRVPAPTVDTAPAQWFIDATEQLGDAALRGVDESLTGEALVVDLEARLLVFTDHEVLHQRLAEAARAVR